MAEEQAAKIKLQKSLSKFFVEGLLSEHPNYFALLYAAEMACCSEIFNAVFIEMQKTGLHNPDFCQIVIHYPYMFNDSDYQSYVDKFIDEGLVMDIPHDHFNPAITMIWSRLPVRYLTILLEHLLGTDEDKAQNAGTILIEVFHMFSAEQAFQALQAMLKLLVQEVAEVGELEHDTVVGSVFFDIVHQSLSKTSYAEQIFKFYFQEFTKSVHINERIVYECILCAVAPVLKRGVETYVDELRTAESAGRLSSTMVLSLLVIFQQLSVTTAAPQHFIDVYKFLQHDDWSINLQAIKIIMKNFKYLRGRINQKQLFTLIDAIFALEERQSGSVCISPFFLTFIQNLLPQQRIIFFAYTSSMVGDLSRMITSRQFAAVRLLQLSLAGAPDAANFDANLIMDLVHTAKRNSEVLPRAFLTVIMVLPTMFSSCTWMTKPLLKFYRKFLQDFFAALQAANSSTAFDQLCVDYDIYTSRSSLLHILRVFMRVQQEQGGCPHELHAWRLLLLDKLTNVRMNIQLMLIALELLEQMQIFQNREDEHNYSLRLLDFFVVCRLMCHRNAVIAMFLPIAASFTEDTAITYLRRQLLTTRFMIYPEVMCAITACMQRLSPQALNELIPECLQAIARATHLGNRNQLTMTITLLHAFKEFLSSTVIKTYIEPLASSLHGRYIELAHAFLAKHAQRSERQTGAGMEFFVSDAVRAAAIPVTRESLRAPTEPITTPSFF